MLYYLTFNNSYNGYNYLLGVANNNVGKKTIVAAIVYLDKYYFFEDLIIPVTYFLLLKLILIFGIMESLKVCVSSLLK